MNLKARLILAFLTIILFPILTFIGLTSLFTYNIEELTQQDQVETQKLIGSIHQIVIENHKLLDSPNIFFYRLEPIIEPYTMEIVISTPEKEVLFDSSLLEGRPQTGFLFTIWESQIQVVTGERYHVEIRSDSIHLLAGQSEERIINFLLIAVVASIIVLILLMIGWTIYIARTILTPLKEIYTATEEMKEGNLDYKIVYKRRDEIGRFISGFNLMRSHLKESISKQRKYEQNRKELIAKISHDLRTPLQSIKGYVEGINDGIVQNEEMKKRYLQVILSKTEQLDRLIEDLFEFSKVELDQLVMEKELVNSKDYFEDVFISVEMEVEGKVVTCNVLKPLPSVIIHIDPYRIQQVITNLLDNAIQYGATKIEIKVTKDSSERYLSFHIIDNGKGISKKDIPNIFNPFYRGEKSRSREYGGTGLGLSIVKSIVEAHDGKINVTSEEGKGSEFIISIPYLEE